MKKTAAAEQKEVTMGISKYNAEGYHDPTAHDAFVNIQRELNAERTAALQKSSNFRPLVFICSPFGDDPLNNERQAIRYCRFAVRQGYIPIAPHIYFTRFLDERSVSDRELGLFMGQVMLTKCAELWVFGERVTLGMERELTKAEQRCMPIRYFTEDMEERNHG